MFLKQTATDVKGSWVTWLVDCQMELEGGYHDSENRPDSTYDIYSLQQYAVDVETSAVII